MNIGTLLKGYKMPVNRSRRSERGDLITYFHERANASRRRDGYKELTMKRLAYLLSVFTTEQLYFLRMRCDTAQEWSKCFNFYVFPSSNKPGTEVRELGA